MPAVPSFIIEPIWDQFTALLPPREVSHPLGCHRPRIPVRLVFDQLVQILVFGCAYHRIADATCSATTLRRRRDEWIAAGIMEELHVLVLDAYDRMIGLARTMAWTNADKKLVWCTERRAVVVAFWIAFSAVILIVGHLVREAWTRYRWDERPRRRP